VAAALAALVDGICSQVGELVTIDRQWHIEDRLVSTTLVPRGASAATVSWVELGDSQIVLSVGHDGRWELGRDSQAVGNVERIVHAVIAGQAVEVFGLDRSQVTVTLDDGSEVRSIGRRGLGGIIPTPGWRRWGRRMAYPPYG